MNAVIRAVPATHDLARGSKPRIFPRVDREQAPPAQLAALLEGAYEFNGERHVLGLEPDWLCNPSTDVEWHILLHKFYYAPALIDAADELGDARYFERWLSLTDSWMRSVPAGFIASDVTGRRVQNWLYALAMARASRFAARLTPAFETRITRSLVEQTRYLCANLAPKRNHRTLELHAIVLASVALRDEPEAAVWREFALRELLANMQADLLADGVHCELSTDYHHLVLRNLLSVRRLIVANDGSLPAAMDLLLQKALDFSLHAHNPAGIVPSLSDGDARSYLDLLAEGAMVFGRADYRYVASGGLEGSAPRERLALFAQSGYCILRSGWGLGPRPFGAEHHVIFDCGPLGEGNHGHLDCLSFELSAGGRRLIADPGRYTYSEAGDINWRVAFRGTAAHNTVTIDGRNQTRYAPKPAKPGGRHPPGQLRHRILGPAPVASLRQTIDSPGLCLLAGRAQSHEYPVRHDRYLFFVAERLWLIVDRLAADEEHLYEARLQLAPESAEHGELDRQSRGARWRGRDWQVLTLPQQSFALESGWVSDSYGDKRAAPRLMLAARASSAWLVALIDPEGADGVRLQQVGTSDANSSVRLRIDIEQGRGAGECYEVDVQDAPEEWRVRRRGAGGADLGHWGAA